MDKQTDVTCKLKKSEISEAYNGMTRVCFDNDSYGRAIQLAAKEQRASRRKVKKSPQNKTCTFKKYKDFREY